MTEASYPDWLPDWRDEEQYPGPESTSGKQWAWEFLRRNRLYQSEWKQRDNADYSVPHSPEEYEGYQKCISMVSLGGRWGLSCSAPDPSIDTPDILLFVAAYSVGALTYEDVKKYGAIPFVPGSWPIVHVVFNLELPLYPQLEDAKNFLRETEERFIREGRVEKLGKLPRVQDGDLMRSYLRCFDAKTAGATIREIAETIYPWLNNEYPDQLGSQRVKDNLEAANGLIGSRYRHLANQIKKK